MAWSLGLRLYGECRIGGAPAEPAVVELSLRRAARRRFALSGTLRSPAFGQRPVEGLWRWPETLELELGVGQSPRRGAAADETDGWSFVGTPDPSAPRSLLGQSLWVGPLTQAGAPRGSLRLRLDLRHDWFSLLRSLRYAASR